MSAFPICVCADLYENKVNLEVPFSAQPPIHELTQKIKEIFDYEASVMRPGHVPVRPFQIKRMQIFNDDHGKWEDLMRMEQLVPSAQIYVFQPNLTDTQADLPRVRQPRHPMAQAGGAPAASSVPYGASPVGGGSPYPPQGGYGGAAGANQPLSAISMGVNRLNERPHVETEEKMRIVFQELDTNGKQFLDYGDLERGFKQRGLHFAVNTIGELFHKADLNRDGRIMYDEFMQWATVYPNTLDAMYYRGKDTNEESQIRNLMRDVQDLNDADQLAAELINEMLKRSATPQQLGNTVKAIHKYVGPAAQALHQDPSRDVRPDMQRALEDLSREVQQRDRQMPEFESQLRAAQERRHVLEQQEMNLLEQEIRLERTRDQMRAQEVKYAEAENMFNSKASETGSPRRARRVMPPNV